MPYEFNTEGRFFSGIPARHLSDQEWSALDRATRVALLEQRVFAYVPTLPVEPAPVEEAAPAPAPIEPAPEPPFVDPPAPEPVRRGRGALVVEAAPIESPPEG